MTYLTNIIAIIFIVASFIFPSYQLVLRNIGCYALSGALTNWLAIHMLFERVPFLYGSGVILNRFEAFKDAIRQLILEQFFNQDHIQAFWEHPEVDYEKLYEHLLDGLQKSSLGGMLTMFGGPDLLASLKDPIISKIQLAIDDIFHDLVTRTDEKGIMAKLDKLVDSRLQSLTAQMVKQIVQRLIREHLGWLVVWGGVFGGIIGLVVALVP